MAQDDKPDFRAGQNIAMKVPAHEFEATVAFYRNVAGLEQLQSSESSTPFISADSACGSTVARASADRKFGYNW